MADKKNWVIRCGGGMKAYMTEIRPPKGGHPTMYTYGTSDPKKAMRFTREEAQKLAEERHGDAVELRL